MPAPCSTSPSKSSADLAQIEEQLATFVDLFSQHPTLAKVLLNPAVPVPRKRAAVTDLTARLQIMPILAKLLTLLAERDRLVVLPDLLASYRDRLLDHRQVVRAEITTAVRAVGRPGAGDRGAAGAGDREDRDGVVARRPGHHWRTGRSHREYCLRRERDAAAGEDQNQAG